MIDKKLLDLELNVLSGDEARNVLDAILAHPVGDGVASPSYPLHKGEAGYFMEQDDHGLPVFRAFDNTTGFCYRETFLTPDGAELFCRGALKDEVDAQESNVASIILVKTDFPQYLAALPPYVSFDEAGKTQMRMQFYDGYALDTNPHGLKSYTDRTAVYYPTVAEFENGDMFQKLLRTRFGMEAQELKEMPDEEKFKLLASTLGKAGRMECPRERYDAAVQAVKERVMSLGAHSFTPEQREKVMLAIDCFGYKDDEFLRNLKCEQLLMAPDYGRVLPRPWLDDALEEMKDLQKGEVRDQSVGYKR